MFYLNSIKENLGIFPPWEQAEGGEGCCGICKKYDDGRCKVYEEELSDTISPYLVACKYAWKKGYIKKKKKRYKLVLKKNKKESE